MNIADYHKRYESEISDLHGNGYTITIYEHNDYIYTEPDPEPFVCAKKPVIIRQKANGNLIGSSCELTIKTNTEQKYLHIFSRREGDYLIRILGKVGGFRWIGVVVPGYYSENFSEPPFDIKLNAVDGLGRLKEIYSEPTEDEVVIGSVMWDRVVEALHKCNVIQRVLVQNVIESDENDFYEIMTTDYLLQEKNTKRLPFYDFLMEYCKTFDFKLLQRDGDWVLYNGILTDETVLIPYDLYTNSWQSPVVINFIKDIDSWVFAGGTLSVIPPFSTVDVVWKRTTYNVGSQSGLYNSEFLDGMDGWAFKSSYFNNRDLAGPDTYDIEIISSAPPTFHNNINEKTAILANAENLYRAPVSNFLVYKFWKLTSLPFHISEADRRISIKFECLARMWNPTDNPQDYYGGPYNYVGYVLFDGDSGQKYNYAWDGSNFIWEPVSSILTEPVNWMASLIENGTPDSWNVSSILEEVPIPESGSVILHIGGIRCLHTNRYEGFPYWYMHEAIVEVLALNSDGEWVKDYEEVLRFQSDEKGFTENETVTLELANKYESLADGNFFVPGINQPTHAGDYVLGSLVDRIQELLIYRLVNRRKKALESISVDVKGIFSGTAVLENVPGRPGKLFYADEIELDLRECKTIGKFTEQDHTLVPVPVTVYSNERKLLEKTIG